MKSLLTWAVLSLAIMAGFTARAATGPYVIELMNKNPKKTWVLCKPISDVKDKDRLGDDSYVSYETCIASADYKRFVRVWEKGEKDWEEKKTPLILRNLGNDVLSVEKTPLTDKKVLSYVSYFEIMTNKKIDRKKIFFGKLKKPILGMCYYDKDLVIIDKEFWKGSSSEYTKEQVVHHELGHCYYERKHLTFKTKIFKGQTEACPSSLMHPDAFGYKDAYRCFHLNRSYYFKELSTPAIKKFVLTIKTYKWENKKWNSNPEVKNAKTGTTFKAGSYICKVYRGKPKLNKYEYVSEFIRVRCSKDYINYISLATNCKYTTVNKSFKKGFAVATRYSNDLILEDTILKELNAVTFNCTIK